MYFSAKYLKKKKGESSVRDDSAVVAAVSLKCETRGKVK